MLLENEQRCEKIGVVIASKGRKSCISHILRALETQTRKPDSVCFSVTELNDLPESPAIISSKHPFCSIIFGLPGTAIQRNRGVKALGKQIDIVVFLDDDFLCAPTWIENCLALFRENPSIIGLSGTVLKDGGGVGSLSWGEAETIIKNHVPVTTPATWKINQTYGCNMAFCRRVFDNVSFDERLVLYGWMEDRDFSIRANRYGMLVSSNVLAGVHLGVISGRVSGKRFGYSQIANPLYLLGKGVIKKQELLRMVCAPLVMNLVRCFFPEPSIDRMGRLKGNLIALYETLKGTARPERILDL